MDSVLVRASDLLKIFPLAAGKKLVAVDNVSFVVNEGETLGLVGESGCGKSTLGRMVLKLIPSDGGTLQYRGQDITSLKTAAMRAYRRHMQIIFQDPYSSLNPRMTIGESIAEPLYLYGVAKKQRDETIARILVDTGLSGDCLKRYPHQFSGGQRQRIVIARAISLKPSFIVADEPVSALDVSIQAQILNLLADLQKKHSLSYLFISHDLAVVRYMSHRIAVMYGGRIVEEGPADMLCERPLHPYTKLLIASSPEFYGQKRPVMTEAKSAGGDFCVFAHRCLEKMPLCVQTPPPAYEKRTGHKVHCHLYTDQS